MEARPWKKSAKGVESTPSSSSSSCFIANLPNPILMEILCRVPIKTLTTSKSVCKSWLNLIKDPYFCQMHQPRSPTEVCFQAYNDSKSNSLELHLGNFNFPNNLDPCHFEIPKFSVRSGNILNYKVVSRRFIFSNSCNGLLCYYDNSYCRFAVVWNPCTSEFITFPPSPLPCRGYGLGFSSKEKKFKLLRLMGGSEPSDVVVADVCTIEKECSWKRVGPCSSHAWFRDHSYKLHDLQAVFLKDTLHWVGTGPRGGDRSHIAIHTFDFENDHFGTLPLPPCFDASMLREDMLGVSDGLLFVTDYRNNTSEGLTVWLMREYGVQGSWAEIYLPVATFDEGLKYQLCRPEICFDNDEILTTYTSPSSSTVCVYNPVVKRGRVIGSGPVSLRVIAYNPSLVLLKDSMLGYDVHVKPNCAGLKQGEKSTTPYWWTPMKNRWISMKKSAQEHGSKAPLTNDELWGTEVEEEREWHINGKGLLQISTTSAADLACQQGAKSPVTMDEVHVSAKREDGLERITTMMGEVLEKLRKEREQRQELEERLRNELEPLKEQTEHLKLQNQQFEEILRQQTQQFEEKLQDEHALVEHLQQQNQQFEERLQDEHANVEHLKQQNQQFEDRLQDEHAKVKHLEDQIEKLGNMQEHK